MSDFELAIRKTLGGGFSIYVRGNEVVYITPKDAEKNHSRAELLADLIKRLNPVRDRGGISQDEMSTILLLVGRDLA